jgi:hypothetical protein
LKKRLHDVTKASAGEFSTGPMIMALMRKHSQKDAIA